MPEKGIDNKSCQVYDLGMINVEVIDDPAAATVALEPVRSRLLSELAKPASAATLATRVGMARQKVNYHLRELESHGLVRLAEERKAWAEVVALGPRILRQEPAAHQRPHDAMGRAHAQGRADSR